MELREAGLRRQAVKRHLHKHNLKHRYEFLESLGKGTYGAVKRARDKQGREVAIKSIRKDRIKDDQDMLHIRRETEIMSSLCHPHIISIYEVFENSSKIVIVMEYASQGDLYDYISERQKLGDQEARRFFRQIVSAVQYCHANGVVHRDLKLENILLDENKNVKVDSWSLGVLLYIFVHGCMPFDGQDYKKLVAQITCGAYKEPSHPSDACGLIRWLLMVNPERRATLSDVVSHWWVNWGYHQPLSEPEQTKESDSPFSIVGGWFRRSSRPLWDNGSKMRSFLRQHLPGTGITRQRSLKRSKRENMSQILSNQTLVEKNPSVLPVPKKGILKKPQQRESGYYSSPEHNEGAVMSEENDAPSSLFAREVKNPMVANNCTEDPQEPVIRKGILKRNGKFSSAGTAPELCFDVVDCSLKNDKLPLSMLSHEKVPSSISQESILSTESFELLDFPTRYRARPRQKMRSMRASLSAEDLLNLNSEDDGPRLWNMASYQGRVAESCLSLGVSEEEAMQVYRTAVLIGREPS
ncbi:NUAK family SNF1-like kinase 2 isoform 2-T2 [Mantella aurantiaca]